MLIVRKPRDRLRDLRNVSAWNGWNFSKLMQPHTHKYLLWTGFNIELIIVIHYWYFYIKGNEIFLNRRKTLLLTNFGQKVPDNWEEPFVEILWFCLLTTNNYWKFNILNAYLNHLVYMKLWRHQNEALYNHLLSW